MNILRKQCVAPEATVRQTLEAITRSGRQIALVVEENDRLAGIVTDGNLRKALLRGVSLDAPVTEAMNRTPIVGYPGMGRDEAVELMRSRSIRHLPIVDGSGRLIDLLFLDEHVPPLPLPTPAVIMAGGLGTRLRPLTEEIPKPLLRVGGKPLLEILIERLRRAGVSEILIALHHKSAMVREQLGDGGRLGVQLSYIEEPERLGTIGALTLIDPPMTRPFFVVNGDILTKCDFRAMWEFHHVEGAKLTVGVSLHQVDIPYGEFTLKGTRVMELDEKPRKEFPVNAGIYLLDPSIIGWIPHGRYFDATDLIRLLLSRSLPVSAYIMREYWLDVGHHHDLEKAARDVAEGLFE